MNSIDVFTRYDDRAGCFSASDKLNKLKKKKTKHKGQVTGLTLYLGDVREADETIL